MNTGLVRGTSGAVLTSSPSGSIVMFGGATAPDGFLLCNGAAVSRTIYAALFTVLSTTYGVGDGSTTFNLPDMTQRVPVGLNGATNPLGQTGGNFGHQHTAVSAGTPAGTTGNNSATLNSVATTGAQAAAAQPHTHTFTGSAMGAHGHGTDNQAYLVVNFIIRY